MNLNNNEILKSVYLHIDSRDRNHNNDPNSNSYTIKLNNHKIRNVKYIELVSAIIPNTEYLINSNNKYINFQENSVDYIVTLSEGNYTSITFASELENQLNGLGTSNTYGVSIDASSGILTISRTAGSNSFSLLFSSGSFSDSYNSSGQLVKGTSPRIEMGFDIADYNDNSGTILSANKINLNGNREIFIEIDNYMGHIDTIRSENNYLKGKIFASIDLDVDLDSIKYHKNIEKLIRKDYFPLLNNLGYLKIQFKDYYGRLFNFRGQENSLLIKVGYIEKGFN